jgi:hypothetical protein
MTGNPPHLGNLSECDLDQGGDVDVPKVRRIREAARELSCWDTPASDPEARPRPGTGIQTPIHEPQAREDDTPVQAKPQASPRRLARLSPAQEWLGITRAVITAMADEGSPAQLWRIYHEGYDVELKKS